MRRIGVLMNTAENDPLGPARIAAFRQRLQQLGWTDGHDVQLIFRYGESDSRERLLTAARDLLATTPDVLVVQSNPAVTALQHLRSTIPTVFVQVGDPVGSGFVKSLARPGGNLTGFSTMEPEMGSKWLELLKEAAPAVTRVMAMLQPDIAANFAYLRAVEVAGAAFKIAVQETPVLDAAGIERALTAFVRKPNGGLVLLPNPVTTKHRELIAKLAITHRMPLVSAFRSNAISGGLMSYGPDPVNLYQRAAGHVDRILKGEKPADLPVEQPTKFELVINLITAKALGLDVPPMLLARADEVIE
jgi:putative ABC transport system substrate-binding protein